MKFVFRPYRVPNWLFNLWIISMVFLEMNIIWLMMAIYWPVPIQKIELIEQKYLCSNSLRSYDYSFGPINDGFNPAEVKYFIDELNFYLGIEAFHYNPSSRNKISFKKDLNGNWSITSWFGETIGLTYCTDFCCGNDNFQVEFREDHFYDFVEAKMLVWHELGHVMGLNHDDSQDDIMNTWALDRHKFNNEVQERYLNKVRKRMGIYESSGTTR